MARAKLIDGRFVEEVQITDIQHVGNEGSRSGIGHFEGRSFPVYNSIVDGFDNTWYEQLGDSRDYETNPWSLTNRNGYWHD